ncbi:MAG: peptidoglycan synthetase [Crocinitomicaceae bacterium]|nr:peptidoglycan synthetase [Crocinitomicaceae bacterium]
MKVHLIAIGGSAMHNLAIALHQKGFIVTGSDDEIVEPSFSRLSRHGLLPKEIGWFARNVTDDLDAVIIGMHARKDNPELLKAEKIGLKIFSYPEYLYEQTKEKTRVVIGGSHGKTTITAMILHALKENKVECDYMVGAQLDGFDCMVKLSLEAKIAVLEGDEYLSSPIDLRPKFHLYFPDIALISGIAWDHINVFPTFENYVEQFRIFLHKITKGGSLIYADTDPVLKQLCDTCHGEYEKYPYREFPNEIVDGTTYLNTQYGKVPLLIFGNHNLQNLNGALLVCRRLGLTDKQFFDAIRTFKGAARRLELVKKNDSVAVYKDFAHSPSKLKATTTALKEQFPGRKLVACMELHTFSSLNARFLEEYKGSMDKADEAVIYFNPHTIEHKKLPPITVEQVREAFGTDRLRVFTDSKKLKEEILSKDWHRSNLLLMTSGNFDGIDFNELADMICAQAAEGATNQL